MMTACERKSCPTMIDWSSSICSKYRAATSKQILYIVSAADPTFVLTIAAEQFAKARTIKDCQMLYGSYFADRGGQPPDMPWWLAVALDLLKSLYKSDNPGVSELSISDFILNLNVRSRAANVHYYISREDMVKIVHAMAWIHEQRLLEEHRDHSRIAERIQNILMHVRGY